MKDINNKELYEISGGESLPYDYGEDNGYKMGKAIREFLLLPTTKDVLKKIVTLWC